MLLHTGKRDVESLGEIGDGGICAAEMLQDAAANRV
jgi:hypothetical protein